MGPTRPPTNPDGDTPPTAAKLPATEPTGSSRTWGRRRGKGRSGRRVLLCVLAAGLLVLGIGLFPEGPVRGAPASVPSLSGYFIVGNGAALVAVGYVGWANVWTSAANGTQVYSNQLYLVFFNLRTVNETVDVLAAQKGWSYTTNATIPPVSEAAVSVTLPTDTSWISTQLWFDGKFDWQAPIATPISLIPNYILNVGGLDLFALTLVSFMTIVSVGGFALGRHVMRKAVYAPSFRLIVWGHVILAAIAAAVFLDYQAIDAAFAGWSPLVYPWVVFPMFFLTSLSYYNRASRVEMIQGTVTEQNEFAVRRTEMRIGRVRNMLIAVGESWGQFWARAFGHYPVIDDGNTERPKALLLPVENQISPTASATERLKILKWRAKHRGTPTSREALTKFPVLDDSGSKDAIDFFALVKSSDPVNIDYPYLTIHKWVPVPAHYEPSPTGGVVMTEPEGKKRVLTWPHWVDPKRPTVVDLEDRHFMPGAMVWLGFAKLRDLGHAFSLVKQENSALKAAFENRVEDEVYTRVRMRDYLVGRATSGISDEEAAQLTKQMGELLGARVAERKEPTE